MKAFHEEKVDIKTVLSVKEASDIFQISERTIRQHLKSGKWPGIKEGRIWRVLNTDNHIFLKYINGRNILADLALMRLAKKTICIHGINALGPLHQGREILLAKLRKGINVNILILDIDCPVFSQREIKEEYIDNQLSGRLRAEYSASVAICKDIHNFTSKYSSPGRLQLNSHDIEPTRAMVIIDPSDSGCCSVNYYPNAPNTRGLAGKHRFFVKNEESHDDFEDSVQLFKSIWNKSHPIKF